jgi:hypothetical protein
MKFLISSVLLLLSNIAFGQSTRRLVKDFDHDFIKDTVYIDSDKDIGEFSRMQNKKMVKVTTIYAKMIYPIIYLETYTDAMNFNYEGRCNALYKKQMEKRQQLSPTQ